MKRLIKVSALALALLLCAGHVAHSVRAGVWPDEQGATKEAERMTDERLAQAKTLFGERCARCHGADGRGQTITGSMLGIPDFTDEKWWKEDKSDARLLTSVTEGRDEMPAFGKKLSRREIAALVAYVRRFNKAAQ